MKNAYIALLATLLFAITASAEEFADVEYLCCDWGPAMTLSTKTNQPPVFSETEEEVYFIKQVGRFTRKKSIVPHLLNSHGYVDTGHGINIYLCKMKADGSGKTEIKELWHNVTYPIDTQANTTWMSLNPKTRKIAFSISAAGSDLIGLWKVNLDGSDLQLIVPPVMEKQDELVANNPSWTPDGEWIVMGWGHGGRIAKCDKNGKSIVYLTVEGQHNGKPRVSPDGTKIVYVHLGDAKTGGIYVMNIDGSDAHLVPPDPNDQYKRPHDGNYPAWSPDGKRILLDGKKIDPETGKILMRGTPVRDGEQHSEGWIHWGHSGLIGFTVAGILFTDAELVTSKFLGESRLVECGKERNSCAW